MKHEVEIELDQFGTNRRVKDNLLKKVFYNFFKKRNLADIIACHFSFLIE